MAAEIERKYEVPVGFAVPDGLSPDGFSPDGISVGEPARHELTAVYYDTPDLRLARDRVALRRRTGGTDAGWHVKRYRGGDDRDELQLPLGRAAGVPARAAAEVRALSRGAQLQPVVKLTTRRTEWPLVDAGGRVLALVADDLVTAQTLGEQTTAQQWRELEVELTGGGDRELLDAVDRRLRAAGATPATDVSKLARALDGRWPQDAGPAVADGSAAAAVGAYLRGQRDALVGYDARVRRDEPDSVHKMRVATRRLRSTLRTFRRMYDRATADRLRGELRWLGEALGHVRDAEVLAARLGRALDAEPDELVLGPVRSRLTDSLRADVARHRRALLPVLDGERYARLLDDLDELIAAPPTGRGARPAAREVRSRVRNAVRRVDRLLDAADRADAAHRADRADRADRAHRREVGPPPLPGATDRDTALHEARKAAKRARYAGEAARPVAGKPARRLAAAMEGIQELLGDHHDSVVTRDLLRQAGLAAHTAGENAFTYGLLHARQAADAGRVEAALPAARRKAARKRIRRWLA